MPTITSAKAVEMLNAIHALDSTVLPALMALRVPCNQALAEHESVQVGYVDDDQSKGYDVGFLGILNGLFGVDPEGWGYIYAHYDVAGGTFLHFSSGEGVRHGL